MLARVHARYAKLRTARRGSIRASAEDNAAHGGNESHKRRNEENEGERRGGFQAEPGVAAALRAVWGSADRGDKQQLPSAAVCHHGRLIPTTPAAGRRCDPVLRSLRLSPLPPFLRL